MAISAQSKFTYILFHRRGEQRGQVHWNSPDGNGTEEWDFEASGQATNPVSAALQVMRTIYASADGFQAPDGQTLEIIFAGYPKAVTEIHHIEANGYYQHLLANGRALYRNQRLLFGDFQSLVDRVVDAATGRVDHILRHGQQIRSRTPGGSTFAQRLRRWEFEPTTRANRVNAVLRIPAAANVVLSETAAEGQTRLQDYPDVRAMLDLLRSNYAGTAPLHPNPYAGQWAQVVDHFSNLPFSLTFSDTYTVIVDWAGQAPTTQGGRVIEILIALDKDLSSTQDVNIPLFRDHFLTATHAIPSTLAREEVPFGDDEYQILAHARGLQVAADGSRFEHEDQGPVFHGFDDQNQPFTAPISAAHGGVIAVGDLPNESMTIREWVIGSNFRTGEKTRRGSNYYKARRDHASQNGGINGPPDHAETTAWEAYATLPEYQPRTRFTTLLAHSAAAAASVALPDALDFVHRSRQARTGYAKVDPGGGPLTLRDKYDRHVITLADGDPMAGFTATINKAGGAETKLHLPDREHFAFAADAGTLAAVGHWEYSSTHWIRPIPIPAALRNAAGDFERGTGSADYNIDWDDLTTINLPSSTRVLKSGELLLAFTSNIVLEGAGNYLQGNGPVLVRERGGVLTEHFFDGLPEMNQQNISYPMRIIVPFAVEEGDWLGVMWISAKASTAHANQTRARQLLWYLKLTQNARIV